MDLIDRNKLLYSLANLDFEKNTKTIDLISKCLRTIEDMPSWYNGYWIPVTERLPDKNANYIVTLENGVVKVLGYSTTQRTTYPKGFYYVEDGISWRQTQNPVVAWMPLPESYKAESECE